VAATLSDVAAPVTVVLDGGELVIDVAEDLRIEMTGWARPVYAGTLSEEFLKELNATE
jgi:diaminopimelate epimerase